ncbi:MAG TPA: hypothetical protein VFO51_01920 [Sphingomicrobium sp.]|nr:hypothetical protein [Sphingomicrobium sp.]
MSDSDRNPSSSSGRDLRQRALDAYESAWDSTSGATRRAGDAVGEAPLVALGAGLAVGALLAALIPTSRREREVLGPYADRVTDAAREAADAARQAGSEKLRELGLTPDAVAEKASEAARHTAQAALGTLRRD